MTALRWGVVGVSELVGRRAVLPCLRDSPSAEIVAIGSRTASRAAAEAEEFGACRSYGSYAAVLENPAVEAVYIPLPNSLHLKWTLKAAAAGKHVLCEKPLACNAQEARRMADACQRTKVFLMEAYVTPFHLRHSRAMELAKSDALGELQLIRTEFTFPLTDPNNYRWRPEMGGGCLLDLGIYCLAPIVALAGRHPHQVAASRKPAASGVDASFTGWLDFGGGLAGTFHVSFEAPERQTLEITGSEGRLRLHQAFTPGLQDKEMEVTQSDGSRYVVPCDSNDPYLAMIEHFNAAVRGEEAPRRTPEESIAMMALLDRLRASADGQTR